jgi:hypothetical protein
MPDPESDFAVELACAVCGSRIALRLDPDAACVVRECLVCPVCWGTGPAIEDAQTGRDSGPLLSAPLGVSDRYRLLGCVSPDGPELEGAPPELRELAKMLWRLAGAASQNRRPRQN